MKGQSQFRASILLFLYRSNNYVVTRREHNLTIFISSVDFSVQSIRNSLLPLTIHLWCIVNAFTLVYSEFIKRLLVKDKSVFHLKSCFYFIGKILSLVRQPELFEKYKRHFANDARIFSQKPLQISHLVFSLSNGYEIWRVFLLKATTMTTKRLSDEPNNNRPFYVQPFLLCLKLCQSFQQTAQHFHYKFTFLKVKNWSKCGYCRPTSSFLSKPSSRLWTNTVKWLCISSGFAVNE